jgi:hypothetical protein
MSTIAHNDMLNALVTELDDCYIAGGFVLNAISPDVEFDDIDIFFRDKKSLNKVKKVLSSSNGLLAGYVSATNVATEAPIRFTKRESHDIQLVHGIMYPSAEALLEEFDFTVLAVAIDLYNKTVVYNPLALISIMAKRTDIYKAHAVGDLAVRIAKYAERGMHIDRRSIRDKFKELAPTAKQTRFGLAY